MRISELPVRSITFAVAFILAVIGIEISSPGAARTAAVPADVQPMTRPQASRHGARSPQCCRIRAASTAINSILRCKAIRAGFIFLASRAGRIIRA